MIASADHQVLAEFLSRLPHSGGVVSSRMSRMRLNGKKVDIPRENAIHLHFGSEAVVIESHSEHFMYRIKYDSFAEKRVRRLTSHAAPSHAHVPKHFLIYFFFGVFFRLCQQTDSSAHEITLALDPVQLRNLVASPTDAFAAVRGLQLAHMALVMEPGNFASVVKLIASLNDREAGSNGREKDQFSRKQSVASSNDRFFRAANQLKDDDDSISVKAPATPPRLKSVAADSKPASPISHAAAASAKATAISAETQASTRRHSSRIDASPSSAKVDSSHIVADVSAKTGSSAPARTRSTRQASKEAQAIDSTDKALLQDPMLSRSHPSRDRDRDRKQNTNSSATTSPLQKMVAARAAPKVAPPLNEEAFFSKSALNWRMHSHLSLC